MDKATKSLAKTLYAAYLTASTLPGRTGSVHVFRCDMTTGDQYFFWSTATDASFVGHAEAMSHLPKSKERQLRSLKHVATVEAR